MARTRTRTAPKAPESWFVREAVIQYRATQVVFADTATPLDEQVLNTRVTSSRDVAYIAHRWIGAGTVERMVAFGLDTRNKIIGAIVIGQGGVSSTMVSMSELVRFLVLSGAVGCIIAHNHPSGDAAPSSEDVELTKRVREVVALVDIKLLDHVVVTANLGASFSFLDSGLV